MSSARYPFHRRGVASRILLGEAIVVDSENAEALVLNETGTTAWSLMDGTRSVEDIGVEIAGRYAAADQDAVSDVVSDVVSFVEDLECRGVLGISPRSGPVTKALQSPPPPSTYAAPVVTETQHIDVVAALCSSTRSGTGGPRPGLCRTYGACKRSFE